jgi:predicted SnoaL-like aldol condensation-catalyzing enzyme
METVQATAEEVIKHHLHALGQNQLEEIMDAYTEESELWTQDGIIAGKEAISQFFSYAFTLFPKDKTSLELKKMIADEDKVFMVWAAESPVISVTFATDCFEVKEGKIVWQTVAFQATNK